MGNFAKNVRGSESKKILKLLISTRPFCSSVRVYFFKKP